MSDLTYKTLGLAGCCKPGYKQLNGKKYQHIQPTAASTLLAPISGINQRHLVSFINETSCLKTFLIQIHNSQGGAVTNRQKFKESKFLAVK